MSKFNTGDKVYLECEIKEEGVGDNAYRLEYKDWEGEYSLTYSVEEKLLHPVDESYNQGLNDAWGLAKKISLPSIQGGYSAKELVKIFGTADKPILDVYTPQAALAKVKAYEESNEIKVGDVVMVNGSELEGIVTKVVGHVVYRLFRDGSCDGDSYKENLIKTGKHFDNIDEFMRSADGQVAETGRKWG